MLTRRRFLQFSALSAATLVGWSTAFGEPVAVNQAAPGLFRRSFDRARARGEPLLVIVVPAAEAARSMRGAVWTDFIESLDQDTRLELAMAAFVCVPAGDVMRELNLAPEAAPLDALAVLVETNGGVPSWIGRQDLAVSGTPSSATRAGAVSAEAARSAWIRRELHARLAPNRATVARRARERIRALTPDVKASIGGRLSSNSPPTRLHAIHVPAWVQDRVLADPTLPRLWLSHYAWAERNPPPGARWVEYEWSGRRRPKHLTSSTSGSCCPGPGPRGSRMFLEFYVEPNPPSRR